MTALDTAKAVLAKASLFDQSFATPDLGIAVAWSEALGDIDAHDALTAVTAHYCEPGPRRIMPGDVIAGVKRIRADRIRTADSSLLEPHDVDPNDVVRYLEVGRARRRALASGEGVPVEPRYPRRDVEGLMNETLAALPAMPPAFPRNDGRNALSPSQPGTQRRPE